MIRRIIQIDKEKCTGCGICAAACHEGAIGMVEGKARLLRDDYCDGLGDCLPAQWPCQIRLISPGAPCFAGAHLLIAADCTAYAYADFHRDFMQGHVTLIGCPKLDAYDYAEKLTAILAANSIQSVTLLRMEVPCCGGLEHAAHTALAASGKAIPLRVVTIRTNGTLL